MRFCCRKKVTFRAWQVITVTSIGGSPSSSPRQNNLVHSLAPIYREQLRNFGPYLRAILDKSVNSKRLLGQLRLRRRRRRCRRCGGGGNNSTLPSFLQQSFLCLSLPLSPTTTLSFRQPKAVAVIAAAHFNFKQSLLSPSHVQMTPPRRRHPHMSG